MKVLHVFPVFGHELTNGSDYYEYMLTRHLAASGVEVEVWTTRTRDLRPTSAFSLRWPNDYPRGSETRDRIRIKRFSASFSLPTALGHLLSWPILRRLRREEKLFGGVERGSRNLVESYRQRAMARPAVYDWLAMLGRGPWSATLLQTLIGEIARFDLVVVGFVPFALVWQVVSIAKLRRKPVAVLALFHPDDAYHHFRSIYTSLSNADLILAQTSYSQEIFREVAPGSNPEIVGAGVDEKLFSSPGISGQRFRDKHRLGGKFVVLSVGRKEPAKGYRQLIEAVDRVNNPNVILVMIGDDIDRIPVSSPHTLYIGHVSREELLDAYAACDAFALLSEYESFGMVFLEAWMMRKPVVGNSHCRPVAAIIRDGVNGFLCDSPLAVASRLGELVLNSELCRALGEAGYRLVKERYTWGQVAERVRQLYEEVAQRSGADRVSTALKELPR